MAEETMELYEDISEYPDLCSLYNSINHIKPLEIYGKFKPTGVWLPKHYAKSYNSFLNFRIRPDDIWVVGLPKTGTTWTKEMVWLIGENINFEGAKKDLDIRLPLFELDGLTDDKNSPPVKLISQASGGLSTMEYLQNSSSPRYITSHLPYSLLPNELKTGSNGKIIYVTRNPKDTLVSYYHFFKIVANYGGTIDQMTDEFISGIGDWLPYWENVKEFWEKRHRPNILFLTYEEMQKDLRSVIIKVSKFLDKNYNENEISQLQQHLSLDSMKSNGSVTKNGVIQGFLEKYNQEDSFSFIRKGKVGSWKEELSTESIKKLDQWIEKNKIHGLFEDI